jgi:transposase
LSPSLANCWSRSGTWLSEQQADTNAQVQAVARKLMNWMSYHGIVPGQHRDRLLLLYQHLDELGLSEELEEFDYYGTTYRLSGRQKLLRQAQKSEKS